MPLRVLQIGLDPSRIDYESEEFAQFGGLSRGSLQHAAERNAARLAAAGFQVDDLNVSSDADAVGVVSRAITRTHYDAVLIGAGVRLVASNSLLFEELVNLVHRALPGVRFIFNRSPWSTPDELMRWFDSTGLGDG